MAEVAFKIEEPILRKLEERAGREGLSIEELHSKILRDVLLSKPAESYTFKDHLLAFPEGFPDDFFEGLRDKTDVGRDVEL